MGECIGPGVSVTGWASPVNSFIRNPSSVYPVAPNTAMLPSSLRRLPYHAFALVQTQSLGQQRCLPLAYAV